MAFVWLVTKDWISAVSEPNVRFEPIEKIVPHLFKDCERCPQCDAPIELVFVVFSDEE
jgi:hypothetical protein